MAPNSKTSKFAVKQLQGEVKRLFEDLIDLSDLEGTRINKDLAFLSRGFAAYTVYSLAGTSPSEAAESVVDGSGDNGIDAIFWHKGDNILWIIQTKWIQKGTGQPEYSGINTFSTGVKNLIEDNLDRPNYRLHQKKEEVENALATVGVKVNLVISHTGLGISKVSRKCLEDLAKDLNINEDNSDAFTYQVFDKEAAYKFSVESANKLNIETEVSLCNWGKVDDPYISYYGQVSAIDLAKLWMEHRNSLFASNLRDFIGRTKANDDITQTLKEDPTSFWYYNNGVTAICQNVRRTTKGIKRLNDNFVCKGISIINGAQTIGSIGR
ncbi:MAG: AIPR family protein, partial [Cyanobacteria bacterium J06621_3]